MPRHILAHTGDREEAIVDHLATLIRKGSAVYLVNGDPSSRDHRPTTGHRANECRMFFMDDYNQPTRAPSLRTYRRLGYLTRVMGR
jgi:hypothetical protein